MWTLPGSHPLEDPRPSAFTSALSGTRQQLPLCEQPGALEAPFLFLMRQTCTRFPSGKMSSVLLIYFAPVCQDAHNLVPGDFHLSEPALDLL